VKQKENKMFNEKIYNREYYQTHKQQKKQYYQENKAKINQQTKQYYQSHKEEQKEYQKQYYQTHKQQKKQYWKQYYQENKAKINQQTKQYYQSHKQQGKLYRQNHLAERILTNINERCNNPKNKKYSYYGGRGIKNFLTLDQIKNLMQFYGYYEMRKKGLNPNIHRINNNRDYTVDNCCFLSAKNHIQLHKLLLKGDC
jgi:hypothetical protein